MSIYSDRFWQMRLEQCAESLRKNNFEVYCAVDPFQAARIFQDEIIKKIKIATASWGDSLTLRATGILDMLKNDPKIEYIETFDSSIAREELIERRRQALLVDLFLTGTNAVTEDGMLVNLDMVGNRVGGITFGPLHVVLVIGRNKIVTDLEAAMQRIKNHAAPLNAMRHEGLKTPCMKTSFCMDCSSPDRICNTWTITEKSFPKNRIKIILVNQDLGI